MPYEALFSPINIRGLTLKNRVVFPGMNTKMAHDAISDQIIAYYAARARGGCGLIVFEVACVHPRTHAAMQMGLYEERHRDELKKLTAAVHAEGAKAGIQLLHSGFVSEAFLPEGVVPMTPENMTRADIDEVTAAYGRAAKLAAEAGFDMVEFHAAHTYLPHEFLSGAINRREDEYGGDLRGRARFALECIEAIRKSIPERMPLFMRVNAFDDYLEGGLSMDEVAEFIGMAAEAGVDVADVSRGNTLSFAVTYEVPPLNVPRGWNIERFAELKSKISIPMVTVGRINMPDMANRAVEEGKADLVAVGRAQIADPEWCNKAMRGEDERIVRCVACMQGCYDAVIDPSRPHITCTRNPMTSREHISFPAPERPKKVLIVGGGMCGMQAALILKDRGHEPLLFEQAEETGGQFVLAGQAPGKEEMAQAASWTARELRRRGVDIRTGTRATARTIRAEQPDEVIIAVGSKPVVPPIPGVELPHVIDAHRVLKERLTFPGKAVIIGGGAVGVEVAELLASGGTECTVIEMRRRIGNGLGMVRRMFARNDFKEHGITAVEQARCTRISRDSVTYEKDGAEHTIPADTVVLAAGAASLDCAEILAACEALGIRAQVIGDAAEVKDALRATTQAFEAAMQI